MDARQMWNESLDGTKAKLIAAIPMIADEKGARCTVEITWVDHMGGGRGRAISRRVRKADAIKDAESFTSEYPLRWIIVYKGLLESDNEIYRRRM